MNTSKPIENSEELKELEGQGRFDAMINRIEMRKKSFYHKMGGKPATDKNMCILVLLISIATEEKINNLRKKLNVFKVSFTEGSEVIYIERDDLFYNSITQFMDKDPQKVRTKENFNLISAK